MTWLLLLIGADVILMWWVLSLPSDDWMTRAPKSPPEGT